MCLFCFWFVTRLWTHTALKTKSNCEILQLLFTRSCRSASTPPTPIHVPSGAPCHLHLMSPALESKARDVKLICALVFVWQATKSALECRGQLDTRGGRSFLERVKQRVTQTERLPLRQGARVRTGQFTTERCGGRADRRVSSWSRHAVLFGAFKTGKCLES